MNNLAIPKSILEQSQEEQSKKIKFKSKISFTVGSLFFILFICLFFYKQNQQNTPYIEFVIQNQYDYPVLLNNKYPLINDISQINKNIQNNIKRLKEFNKTLLTVETILHKEYQQLSQMDKIRLLQIQNLNKINHTSYLGVADIQRLKILGNIDNTKLQNEYHILFQNEKIIYETEQLQIKRKELLKQLHDSQITKDINQNYYLINILIALCLISSLLLLIYGVFLYIKHEKMILSQENNQLLNERLELIAISNQIKELEIYPLKKIPDNSGFIGNLIDAINQLFQKLNQKYQNYDLFHQSLNQEYLEIPNDYTLVQDNAELQVLLNQLQNKLKKIKNNNIHIEVSNILQHFQTENNYEATMGIYRQISECDSEMNNLIQNLEFYAKNTQSVGIINLNGMDSILAFKVMQEKLPNLMNKKLKLNADWQKIIQKHNTFNHFQNQINDLQKHIKNEPEIYHQISDILLQIEKVNDRLSKQIHSIESNLKNQSNFIQKLTNLMKNS